MPTYLKQKLWILIDRNMETKLPKGIELEEVTATYSQFEGLETIEIKTANEGAGKFFVIKTDKFSFDSIDEMVELLNDFKKRADL